MSECQTLYSKQKPKMPSKYNYANNEYITYNIIH